MLMGWLDAVYVMAYRQLKHFVRSPSRIIASIVNPLIWILFFGMGWAVPFASPEPRPCSAALITSPSSSQA